MTTPPQDEANRRNAQRSTGPRTPEGKARSSANAVVHGAYANRLDLITMSILEEDLHEVVAMFSAIVCELAPTSVLEEAMARSVAQRLIGQVRANRLTGTLVDHVAVASQVPLSVQSATFKVTVARYLLTAVQGLRDDSPIEAEQLARVIHSQMANRTSLLLRFEGVEVREPATTEEWRTMLRKLIVREHGSLDAAERKAETLIANLAEDANREAVLQRGVEATAILERLERMAAFQDRIDRGATKALIDYHDLKARMRRSTHKLPLNGRVTFDDGIEDDRIEDDGIDGADGTSARNEPNLTE